MSRKQGKGKGKGKGKGRGAPRESLPPVEVKQLSPYLYEIPKTGGMRVPGRIYASGELMQLIGRDRAPSQVANVAHLPGIVGHSLAMPDIHWGYGFPIGGVAAMDPEDGGVVSPGGIGYDINCGVRLLRTDLSHREIADQIPALIDGFYRAVPSGVGSAGGIRKLSNDEMAEVARGGAEWAVGAGYGSEADLAFIEEGGRIAGADPSVVSRNAFARGSKQLGTLGSGNHFLELQRVDQILDPAAAEALGLFEDGICVTIHCGSRGFGYQICDDHLQLMREASERYGIRLPDPQLCCAPLGTPEADRYLAAMAAAANYAFANRQVIRHNVEKTMQQVLDLPAVDLGLRVVYDVCHNIGKYEEHRVGEATKRLFVHRKGATRAYGPGHPLTPAAYREVGQPVLIPGDMGRYSFVLVGTEKAMTETWGSSCHGAGRVLSRKASSKQSQGMDLRQAMADMGVYVRAKSQRTLSEEMPHAYKDVSNVVDVMERAGISKIVARLRPIGVAKG